MKTGLSYDSAFLRHDTGRGHPEQAARLIRIWDHLRTQPWFARLIQVPAREVEMGHVHAVHSRDYIHRARQSCASGAPFLDSMDVSICRESFEIAMLAAGTPIALADRIVAGDLENGFALVRPPGHHAEHDMALGFCLFNNVAILARYLQKQHGVDKVLILDWDVHHGNGTQHRFEEDPSVLYVSAHQYPFYPGTGAAYEEGSGQGRGATLNCPMPAGSTDADYEKAFMDKILPKIDQFRPEFLIISAGFDAHQGDPLAQINLSTGFFGWMTDRMMEVADKHAAGRIVSVLEGGYNLQKLPLCVAEHVASLSGNR